MKFSVILVLAIAAHMSLAKPLSMDDFANLSTKEIKELLDLLETSDAEEPSKRTETEGDHEPNFIDSEQRREQRRELKREVRRQIKQKRVLLKDEEKDLAALNEVTRGEEETIPVVSEKEYEAAFETAARGEEKTIPVVSEKEYEAAFEAAARGEEEDQSASLRDAEIEADADLSKPEAAEKKVVEVEREHFPDDNQMWSNPGENGRRRLHVA